MLYFCVCALHIVSIDNYFKYIFFSVFSSLNLPLGSVAITSQNMVQMKKDFILGMDIVSF